MKAIILAGGLGTRMGQITQSRPKVMLPIGGKPALQHLIELCRRHQIKEVILSLHYLPGTIKDYFGNGHNFGIRIKYIVESKPMGGAGAIKLAQSYIGAADFFMLNGDVMTDVDLSVMMKFHSQKNGLGTVFVHRTDHPFDSDLVEFDENNLITKFFRPQLNSEFRPLAKTGTHIFKPKVFQYIPENQPYSLEKQLLPDLIANHEPLYAYLSDCYSKDMGTPERLTRVRKDFQNDKFCL